MNFCELCKEKREATHRDSVPDPNVGGMNMNECGYRYQFLCLVHAMDRKSVATSRVEPLELSRID